MTHLFEAIKNPFGSQARLMQFQWNISREGQNKCRSAATHLQYTSSRTDIIQLRNKFPFTSLEVPVKLQAAAL